MVRCAFILSLSLNCKSFVNYKLFMMTTNYRLILLFSMVQFVQDLIAKNNNKSFCYKKKLLNTVDTHKIDAKRTESLIYFFNFMYYSKNVVFICTYCRVHWIKCSAIGWIHFRWRRLRNSSRSMTIKHRKCCDR